MRIGGRHSGLKCVRIRVECVETHSASQVQDLPVILYGRREEGIRKRAGLRRQGGATLKAGLRMRIGGRHSGLKCVRIRVECVETHSASQVQDLPVLLYG